MKSASPVLPALFSAWRPRRVRTMRRFAADEVVLTTGPRENLRFDENFMPFMGLVLDEYDRGRYRRFFLSGPTQTGKTLLGVVIPALYHLFEIEEDIIIGAPKVELGQAIYEERIRPVLERSRYRDLLPRKGRGSSGGLTSWIRFGNGRVIRFLGAGGKVGQSSFTARILIGTEIDKMDQASTREADPWTQMEARTSGWGDRARVYGECTMSTPSGRIYQEICDFGTNTRLVVPCPKCRTWTPLERDAFKGWEDAQDLDGARSSGAFVCPGCSSRWSESDRAAALRTPALLSAGERIQTDGTRTGAAPNTNTWGFRWSGLASALIGQADIAEAEWRAHKSGRADDEKAVLQQKWGEPWRERMGDLVGISRELVLSKIVKLPRGHMPDGTVRITVAIDVGLHLCWWLGIAWTDDARGHVFDYGALQVAHLDPQRPDKTAILPTLRTFRDEVLAKGWAGRRADLVFVDAGFEPDLIYLFAKESGERVAATKGFGSGDGQGAWRGGGVPSESRQVGQDWRVVLLQPGRERLVELHVDRWKREVHGGFVAAIGSPGSLTLYDAPPQHHAGFAQQITAEREEEQIRLGGGVRRAWVRVSSKNHYLDVASYARAAADVLGIRSVRLAAPKVAPKARLDIRGGGGGGIRTKY